MIGSWTKKSIAIVLRALNGSTYAVLMSGNSTMSDWSMVWKPRIDEPSNATPLATMSASNVEAGSVTCCWMPGKSVKRTSRYSTPSSLMNLNNSSALPNMGPPRPLCGLCCR